MKHHLPPLDSLKAFESAARHLSFSVAADELCITKSAISYQIRKLEDHLACPLFKRAVRRVYLTDAGQVLLQTTQHLFAELDDTLQRVQGEKRQAGVTIAATTYVAARWLSPRISEFNNLHPDIPVMLQHSVNSADFRLTDVDLAIRWGPCGNARLPSQLGEIPMPLYPAISPGLLQRNHVDCNRTLAGSELLLPSLQHIPLLCEDRQQDLWQEWFDSACAEHRPLPNPRRIISDANVRVQAAIDGQGLILADNLMASELANGLLRAPFHEKLTGYGYRWLYASNRVDSEAAGLLKEWMSDWMA